MTLAALRCPNCAALLENDAVKFCSYCGAALVHAESETRMVSVYLDSAGDGDHVPVVQAVFRHLHAPLNIGLKDSLDLVNSAPCVLVKEIGESVAKSLVAALTAAKATARIV